MAAGKEWMRSIKVEEVVFRFECLVLSIRDGICIRTMYEVVAFLSSTPVFRGLDGSNY